MKACEMCKKEIHDEAAVCPYCHYHQKGKIRRWQIRIPFLNIGIMAGGFVVTFGMLIASFMQLNEAMEAREAANSAFRNAELAAETSIKAKRISLELTRINRDMLNYYCESDRFGNDELCVKQRELLDAMNSLLIENVQ